jgi:hypothetical protein
MKSMAPYPINSEDWTKNYSHTSQLRQTPQLSPSSSGIRIIQ